MGNDQEIAKAVETLHQASLRLRELGGEAADAVLHAPSATTYLFPDVQAELLRMERAERQQAAERAAILDALPAQLAILDEAGTIVAVNEAWRAFARASNDSDSVSAVGLSYLEVCRGLSQNNLNVAQKVSQGLREVLAGQAEEVVLEYPCQTPDALLWFLIRIAPLRGAERPGAVVMHVDVTEKHIASRREAELLGRIGRLMDEAGVGLLVHRNHVPVFANPALVTMLGLDNLEEILGLADFRRLLHLPAESELESPVEGAAPPDSDALQNRVTGRRPDGKSLTLETRAFPIKWGEEPAVCTMFTDITHQLRVEEQLRAAQRLEAIGQLTGGIAHDFNNLLTVILGSGDLLVDALQHEPRLARLAIQMVLMAERGAELTKRLLAFARRQPLNPQSSDLNARLVAIEALLRPTLGADVEIVLELSENLWPAMVDPGEFDNAILNLAINSRDAMPNGGHLTLRSENAKLGGHSPDTGQDMPPGEYVVVTVSDDGAGMSKATLDRIFEPFYTTKEVGKGSGLGLSMVFGFVKQTGGHIEIFSEPNEGTTVKMYFPRFSGEGGAKEAETEDGHEQHGTETILVVEDEQLLLKMLTKQLVTLGYKVFAASEGVPALDILRERSDIDLLFSDIVLPGGMNGRQIADAAQEIRPGMKVLFTSGYSRDAIAQDGRLEPGVELLSKPYRRSELAARIRRVLDS